MADRLKGKLTQDEAQCRADSITGDLFYNIFYDFRLGAEYSGQVRIEFRLQKTSGLFLDFAGDKVLSLNINGSDVADIETARQGTKILLDAALLTTAQLNIVTVKFHNRYYTDGNGVQTFTDVDGSQYLYTQSEPYWGNRVAPMFDQPDLKAMYRINVAAPADWEVMASQAHTCVHGWDHFVAEGSGSEFFQQLRTNFTEVPAGHRFWQFPETKPLSTYLLNVVCGPYARVDLEESKRFRGIPMSIYCRKGLLPFAVAEAHNIFEFNKRGVEYYEKVFQLEYTFGKLDTLFCPEFTVGAMEYPGAVTYTERLLPKEPNTTFMVSLRGGVILHELAHMWFGNTVTMKWWNDLWLNESFADFVCYKAWDAVTPLFDFPVYDAWLEFMKRKGWGYRADQEVTTHQISGPVADTEVADNIFDGITYSKGASSLKHLVAIIGDEVFSNAMGEYFNNFKWRNSTLKDLLDIYQKHLASKIAEHPIYDIAHWQKTWLEEPGMNHVNVSWTAGTNNVTLNQGVCLEQFPTLRYHRIDLAFFNAKGEVVSVNNAIMNDKAETIIECEVGSDIVAVLPNHNDLSFIKVILDEVSLAWFSNNLHLVTDPLAKGLVLRSMYDGVRDARVKATLFIDTVSYLIEKEDSNQVVDLIYTYIGAATAILTSSLKNEYMPKLYAATKAKCIATQDSKFRLSLTQKLIGFGYSDADIADLHAWLSGTHAELKGDDSPLTNDQRWSIVVLVNGSTHFTAEQKQATFDAQWSADETDTKTKNKLVIDAMLASDEKRAELWEGYFSTGEAGMSYDDLKFSTSGFNSRFVALERKTQYHQKFFEVILDAMRNKTLTVGNVRLYF